MVARVTLDAMVVARVASVGPVGNDAYVRLGDGTLRRRELGTWYLVAIGGFISEGSDTGRETPPREDPVAMVAAAWNDAGRRPDVHRAAQAKLFREWPTLARAVEEMLARRRS
jgi:hypothetical protein